MAERQAESIPIMKLLLIPLLALCLPAFATEEDKQALRDLRALYEKSVAAGDLDALKPHLAADFTAVMITAEEVKGFDGILSYWEKVREFVGEGGTYRVSIDPDDSIFEGNLALAKGRALEQVTLKNGRELEFTSLWTAVARKEDGAWKLVRIHAAIDPVSNPIIDFLNRSKRWIFAGAGLLTGLAAGLLIRRRRRPTAAP
jgi:ketosteroid isomerase-like protein